MYDSWSCLMVEDGPGILPENVRTTLKAAACNLHLRKWDKMQILNDVVDGVITTSWTTHLVGTRSGVLFRAHIDCADGTDFKVNFLLSEDDLKRGAEILKTIEESGDTRWQASSVRAPVDELYHFYDLTSLRNRVRH